MVNTTTEKWSFKGWDFKTWLVRNKDSLKLIVSGATGIAIGAISGLTPTWSVPLGALAVAVSKMILDSLDYFQSE